MSGSGQVHMVAGCALGLRRFARTRRSALRGDLASHWRNTGISPSSMPCSFAAWSAPWRTSSVGLAVGPGRAGSAGQEGFSTSSTSPIATAPRPLRTGGLWQREGGGDARRRHSAQDPRRVVSCNTSPCCNSLRRSAARRRTRLRAGCRPRGRSQPELCGRRLRRTGIVGARFE